MASERFRVVIRCSECNEKFILRGRLNKEGGYDTGFKRCVCGNEKNLEIDVSPE